MKSKNPHSGCRQVEVAKTLDTTDPNPCKNQGGIAVVETVYCLQGNGIDRADTAGCNGKGVKEDVRYTLNTIDRPAVAYAVGNGQLNQISMAEVSNTLDCMHDKRAVCILKKTFQNTGQGWWNESPVDATVRTPCGGDATLANVCVERTLSQYIVRRLTPTECARLQGFPDDWWHPDYKETFSNDEYAFWMGVRNVHAAINGKQEKQYTREQMVKWYNGLHTDSAEYKMWGNGIALPPALYCMQGIAEALGQKQAEEI